MDGLLRPSHGNFPGGVAAWRRPRRHKRRPNGCRGCDAGAGGTGYSRCSLSAVARLAGASGQNAECNLHRWVDRQSWRRLLPSLYKFPMPKVAGCKSEHFVLLPHDVSATLHSVAPELFAELLAGSSLLAFWTELGGQHPVLRASSSDRCVPVGLHGDDAGAHGSEKIVILMWGAVHLRLATLDSRNAFAMLKDIGMGAGEGREG